MNVHADRYRDFAALAAHEVEHRDYRISVLERRRSRLAIVAPHGGSIERRTSAIARALAGEEFNLYLFEGLDPGGTFDSLHITSHRFDEPRCLRLISGCEQVVAVHGCAGDAASVMIGGRDEALIAQLASALRPLDVDVRVDDHPYPGTHRMNICNRGRSRRGVQLELSDGLRGSDGERAVIGALRRHLLDADARPACRRAGCEPGRERNV